MPAKTLTTPLFAEADRRCAYNGWQEYVAAVVRRVIKVESSGDTSTGGPSQTGTLELHTGKIQVERARRGCRLAGRRANIKRSSPRAVGAVHLHCEPIYYSAILNRQRSRAELANIENGVRKAQRRTYAAYEDGTGSRHPSGAPPPISMNALLPIP